MQVKAEIEDTEDAGDQEMHQTSLETEDSFIVYRYPRVILKDSQLFHPVKMSA